MPVIETRVTQFYRAVLYNGTNAQDIADWIVVPVTTVHSVVSGVATFLENGESERIVAPGEYVVGTDFYGSGVYLVGNYAAEAFEVIWTRLDEPAKSVVGGFGVASVPTLLLNASTTINVVVTPAQASTTYDATAYLVGAVGPLVITGTSIVDEDTVQVTVQAQGLAYVSGAQVLVTTH